MQEYAELMQYEPWVERDKVGQLSVVKKSANNDRYAVGIKKFKFADFIDAIKTGHSVKRVHTFEKNFVPTKFICIDIDDENAKLTYDELKPFINNNCVVMNSTSKNPYKWHIYLNNPTLCYNTSDLYDATIQFMHKLEAHIGRKVEFDHKLTNTYGQWIYGVPQLERKYDVLKDTIMFTKQITKNNNYLCFKVDPTKPRQSNFFIIPFKQKDVAKLLNKNVLYDKTYHIQFCWEHKKRVKIQDGNRYRYGISWVINLVAQYFKLTKKYNVDISLEQLLYNLQHLCDVYFVDGSNTNCYTQLVSFLMKLYNQYINEDYSVIENSMNGYVHKYMTPEYRRDLILQVRNTMTFDEENKNFIESNRKNLLIKLQKVGISEVTFRKHIKKQGFNIKYTEILPRSDKGLKYKQYLNSCKSINNTLIIDKKHISNKKFIDYCKLNNIKVTSKALAFKL